MTEGPTDYRVKSLRFSAALSPPPEMNRYPYQQQTQWQYGYTLGPPTEANRGNYSVYQEAAYQIGQTPHNPAQTAFQAQQAQTALAHQEQFRKQNVKPF